MALATLVGCSEPVLPETPSYAVDIAPVLEGSCTRCHTRAGRWDGGVELDRYASARSARIRSVCTAVDSEVAALYPGVLQSANAEPGEPDCADWKWASMPPGAMDKLTLYEQELFVRWVATGAQP